MPYTIYTTGIAWRKDHVNENPYTMTNPWAMLWQPKYKGRIAILDDYREGISLGLMKNGNYDLNTTNPDRSPPPARPSRSSAHLVNVRIDNNDYTQVPSASIWIHHAWSGDIAAAEYYMPKGVTVKNIGYWFPADGRGPVANDTNVVLARDQPGAGPPVPQLLARLAERDDQHQLQRLHAAPHRRHPAAAGQGADPAEA